MLRADDRRGTFVARITSAPAGSTAPTVTVTVARAGGFPPPAETAAATVSIVASLYVFNQDHLALNNFWVRLLVQSLEQTLSAHGHHTRFFNLVQGQGQPLVPLRDMLQTTLQAGNDAIALIGFGMSPQEIDESLSVLDHSSVPMVCITSGELRRPVSHVFFDNRSAGYDAAQCLLRNGCPEIVYLAPFTTSWVEERLEGVRSAVEHAGAGTEALRIFPESPKPWLQEEDPEIPGYEAARRFLAEGKVPAGVICANDGVAFGFLQAAAEHHWEPGRDFAIISFDDHPDARARHLTTLRPPMEAMGQEASRLLLCALRGDQTSLQVRLRWHLIPRSSCRIASRPQAER